MKVVYCFVTKNRHGCDSRQVCFQTDRTAYSFIHSLLCIYPGGIAYKRISGVFLANLKIGLMHYKKIYSCINQMQHLHACSSLMFGLLWWWYPFQRACIILINLYMQAAQPKASNRSPSRTRDWTVQLKRAHSQCFEKLIPVFLFNMIFQSISLEIFLESKSETVFRFRNQSLSIQCKDVLFKI